MLCFSRLHSFLLMIDIPWYDSISVICFLIHRPLHCLQLGTITELASGNLLGQIFSWTYVLVSLECHPSTETAGSSDGGLLNFMRNCQIAFQRDIYGNVWEFQLLQILASTSILLFILSQPTEKQATGGFASRVFCHITLTAPTGDIHPKFYSHDFLFPHWLSPSCHLSLLVPHPKPYLLQDCLEK